LEDISDLFGDAPRGDTKLGETVEVEERPQQKVAA
jgi:hypothetical protein